MSVPTAPVPRIPWSDLTTADGARTFGDALRVVGFAIVTDAPLPTDLLAENYARMQDVFGLGVDVLTARYSHPEIGFQRGYMPTRTEFGLRCGGEPDDKEVMAFGPYHNVDVVEVPGHRAAAEGYFAACQSIGYALMECLAGYLDPDGAERGWLLGLFRDPAGAPIDDSHMRHIRYPGTAKRMACAHTDSNVLSLLPAATRGGLEVMDNDGRWRAVETERGDLVINAGDMLNFLSGGKIRSTLHRVENKFGDPNAFRHSMPFFYHPDHRQELRILASCRDEPIERRMFPHTRITGYALLYELLSTYKVIPPEISLDAWTESIETLKRDGF